MLMLDILNFAHRGFSGRYLENTMKAFEEAYQEGADGIELDVQLTADGKVVVFHDSSLQRLTNVDGLIEEFTFSELSQITMPHGLETYSIPFLDEYLEWVQSKDLITNIELKSVTSDDKGLEEKVIEKIYGYGQEDKVILSSFHKNSIIRVKNIDPLIECALLTPSCSEQILHLTKEMGVEYIHPHFTSLNRELVELASELELGVNVWTVGDQNVMEEVREMGALGIITDYPNVLNELEEDVMVQTS